MVKGARAAATMVAGARGKEAEATAPAVRVEEAEATAAALRVRGAEATAAAVRAQVRPLARRQDQWRLRP